MLVASVRNKQAGRKEMQEATPPPLYWRRERGNMSLYHLCNPETERTLEKSNGCRRIFRKI